jgi:hypothetical protein
MTQTTTSIERSQQAADAGISMQPADILMHLIVTLLAPMFLCASGGNIAFARMAAIGTVNAYRARNQADLVAIAQIIAFGLTALGSLSLSMADNLSLSMTLRLRTNANAPNRSAQQNRRALAEGDRGAAPWDAPLEEDPAEANYQATVIAGVAEARQATAEVQARMSDASPAPAASPTPVASPLLVAPPVPEAPPMTQEQRHQAMWARAISDVAGEQIASLQNLPPPARKAATFRAAVLSSAANVLLANAGLTASPSGTTPAP